MTAEERQEAIDRMVREQRAAADLINAGCNDRMTWQWHDDALLEECCLRLDAELERAE